jgi:uncharacterized membrane protein
MRRVSRPLAAAWHRLTSALWFVPAVVVAAAVAFAFLLVQLDPDVSSLQEMSPRLFTVSPEGARDVLTAISMAMLSVAGLVFSITITTLALTSQQFTSRVLRTFIRDRGNQLVLGAFLGAFAYSLIVLRTVRNPTDEPGFVPQLAMLVAIAFALATVAFLIYFINHVATSIQASAIVARVAEDTIKVLHKIEDRPSISEAEQVRWASEPGTLPVLAPKSGYVQAIDLPTLGRCAERRGLRIRAEVRVGNFVVEGQPLVSFIDHRGEDSALKARDYGALRRAVTIGDSGDIRQDPSYGMRQLVDIALRALSPSTNDTTTAVTCIDYLGAVLVKADGAARPNAAWTASDGVVRAYMPAVSFHDLLNQGFNQIRESAEGNLTVLLRQLSVLRHLEERVTDAQRRDEVARHAQLVLEVGERSLASPDQRRLLTLRAGELLSDLRDGTGGLSA